MTDSVFRIQFQIGGQTSPLEASDVLYMLRGHAGMSYPCQRTNGL